jgi:hypothetical protein
VLLVLPAIRPAVATESACTVHAATQPPVSETVYDTYGVSKLKRLARKGDAHAMNSLGIRYGTGQGVKLDSAAAFGYYKSAAELGFSTSQANLAFMYLNGEGTDKNPELAFSWAQKSAAAGNARGLEFAGYMLATGNGVARNLKEAAYCYLLAARRGNLQAQDTLATIYSDGLGIPVDRKEAARWRERAQEARANAKPWVEETPDPPMPPEWDSPFVFVADIPANSRIETGIYAFDVALDNSAPAAQWQHYTTRAGTPATVLRAGLPGYDTVVVSVMPKDRLHPSENLLAAARRLQPHFNYEPVPGKKLCVRTSKNTPVQVGDGLIAFLAYCVQPRDRSIYELATSWKSLAIQVGSLGTIDTEAADLKKTMAKLLGSFTFK